MHAAAATAAAAAATALSVGRVIKRPSNALAPDPAGSAVNSVDPRIPSAVDRRAQIAQTAIGTTVHVDGFNR
jgi:hypothetical protein